MKRILVFIAIIVFVFGLAACRSAPKIQAPPPPPPQVQAPPPPEYQKAAIELFLKADPRLNLYRDTSHTLVACVYELRDPNAFNQLIDEQDGLTKLLECGRFDGSVAYAKKLVLLPGQEVSEVLDQAEGAKYLGLVGGYFAPAKEKPYRLYRIPTAGNKPVSMKVDLYLGPQAIQDMGTTAPQQEMREQSAAINNKMLALKNIEDCHAANREQRYEEAISCFKNALVSDPNQSDAYAGMSIAFHYTKQHSQAIEMANTALQRDPNSHTGHYAMALIMYKDKRYGKALLSVNRAIELYPQSPFYFYLRGETYLKFRNSKLAIKDFEQACKMNYPQACQSADRLKPQLKGKKRN